MNTALLPTGTLEPHGVANKGADITAPVAVARTIAAEVHAMVAPAVSYGSLSIFGERGMRQDSERFAPFSTKRTVVGNVVLDRIFEIATL